MVPASNLWAFVLASVVLIVIPGPSVLFVIGRSLALGRMGGAGSAAVPDLVDALKADRDPAVRDMAAEMIQLQALRRQVAREPGKGRASHLLGGRIQQLRVQLRAGDDVGKRDVG